MTHTVKNEEIINDFEDFNIQEEDYVLVINAEGQLKTVVAPESATEHPENVAKILQMFGVYDLENNTLH